MKLNSCEKPLYIILMLFLWLKILSGKEENLALGCTCTFINNLGDQLYFDEKRPRILLRLSGWLTQNINYFPMSFTYSNTKSKEAEQRQFPFSYSTGSLLHAYKRHLTGICFNDYIFHSHRFYTMGVCR